MKLKLILTTAIAATSGPSGENPSGLVSFDFDAGAAQAHVSGPVTCLA